MKLDITPDPQKEQLFQLMVQVETLQDSLEMSTRKLEILDAAMRRRIDFERFLRGQVNQIAQFRPLIEPLMELGQAWEALKLFPGGVVGAAFAWTLAIALLGETALKLFF